MKGRRDTFNCPSEECWDYDAVSGACTLKTNAQCVTLSCEYDAMAVNFKGSLFGVADGDSSSLDSQLGIKFEVFFRFLSTQLIRLFYCEQVANYQNPSILKILPSGWPVWIFL